MEGTTQGDPAVMAIYAIAIIPIILMLVAEANQVDNTTKTAAYADDLTAAGTTMRLRNWWEKLCRLGPKFSHFLEGSKSWLIVKEKSQSVFKDTNIKITKESQRHLGATIGSETFKQNSGLIKGFKHKSIYFMRTIPNIKTQLKQLDDVIRTELIPAVTGGVNCSETERRLVSLPPRFGGLGIPIFSESAQKEYEFSIILSKDLTTKIINQQPQFATNNNAKKIKSKIKLTKMQYYNEELQKSNGEQGASSWLTTVPLAEEGYNLTEQLFWDLSRIRYGWTHKATIHL